MDIPEVDYSDDEDDVVLNVVLDQINQKLRRNCMISTKGDAMFLMRTTFSMCLFSNYFREQNYSLFKPHKGRCNICVGKDTGNAFDEDYTKHYEMKCSALH